MYELRICCDEIYENLYSLSLSLSLLEISLDDTLDQKKFKFEFLSQ